MSVTLSERLARYAKLVDTAGPQTSVATPLPNVDPAVEGLARLDYPEGSVLVRETTHPLAEPFGEYAITLASASPAHRLPGFLAGAGETSPETWAFVDCETTGLSGGVGTLAFLVAVGRPVADRFVIRQFFLADPADERGFLHALQEALAGARVLWTYNGNCFDLPLLETRFRFWRMEFERSDYGHVDLLVPTRVLFRRRIEDCSLVAVEERILKVARVEDLPGAEVPAVFFEYLQTGRSPRLHRVFEHNRVDVLSLAVYAGYLITLFSPGSNQRLRYPEDVVSLARYYLRRREWHLAEQCLTDVAQFALGPELEADYHRLSALLHKRSGNFARAATHFQALVGHPGADPIDALEELAKYYEHRRRETREALRLVERAIALADQALAFGGTCDTHRLPALYHRRARLHRKLLLKQAG